MTAARATTPDAKNEPLSKAEHSNPSDEQIIDSIASLLVEKKDDDVASYLQDLSAPLSKEVVLTTFPTRNGPSNLLMTSLYCKNALKELVRITPQELLDTACLAPVFCAKGATELHNAFSDDKIPKDSLILLLNSVSSKVLNDSLSMQITKSQQTPLMIALAVIDDEAICAYLSKVDNDRLNQSAKLVDDNKATAVHYLVPFHRSARVVDALMRRLTKETINEICATSRNIVALACRSKERDGSLNRTIMHIANYIDKQVLVDTALRMSSDKLSTLAGISVHGLLMHKLGIASTDRFCSELTPLITALLARPKYAATVPMESLRYLVALNPKIETAIKKADEDKNKDNKVIRFFKNSLTSQKAQKEEPNFKVRMATQLNQLELSRLLVLYNSLPETTKNEDGKNDILFLIISYLDTPTYFIPDLLRYELHAPSTVPVMTAAGKELHKYLNKALYPFFSDMISLGIIIPECKDSKKEAQSVLKKLVLGAQAKTINEEKSINAEDNPLIQTTMQYLSSNPHTLLAVNQELSRFSSEQAKEKINAKENKKSFFG